LTTTLTTTASAERIPQLPERPSLLVK
jgi:hypothetical protein